MSQSIPASEKETRVFYWTLRKKLALAFLLITLFPIFGLGYFNYLNLSRILEDKAGRSLMRAANQTASQLDSFIRTNKDTVLRGARLPGLAAYLTSPRPGAASVQRETLATLNAIKRLTRARALITSIALLDSKGRNLIDTQSDFIGRDESDKNYFIQARVTRRPYVSNVVFDQNGDPGLFFSQAVYNNSFEFVGVLRIRFTASILHYLIAGARGLAGERSHAVLLDEYHFRLAYPEHPDYEFLSVVPQPLGLIRFMKEVDRLPDLPHEKLSTNCPDLANGLNHFDGQKPFLIVPGIQSGIKETYAAVAVKTMTRPWTVVFMQPRDVYLAPVRFQFRNMLLLVMGMAIVFAITGILVAGFLTKPIAKLTEVTSAIAAGDLDQPLDIRYTGEVGRLADSFADMQAAIQNKILDLNREIQVRREAEKSLREKEERLRALVDSSTDSIVTLDTERRFTGCNPAFLSCYGFKLTDVLGVGTEILHPTPEKYAEFGELVYPQVRERGFWRGEWEYKRVDGHVFPAEAVISAMITDEGEINGYVVVQRDITERKKAEQENQNLQIQLQHAQKMEAVGTLASGIAHDFNNILQAISGYVQLLQAKGADHENRREYLTEVDRSVERASDLVQRLLTFSRKVEPKLEPADLNQVIEHTVKILERTIPKMICIETHLAKNLGVVNADPNQIERVLLNLGANARDVMPDGGRLLVETENVVLDEEYCKTRLEVDPGPYVVLRVSDTGFGMDEEIIDRVFEPFFTTKDVGRGTGLGMSTVYGIVKGHGGHISCESRPGEGTTFVMHFPILESAEPLSEPTPGKIEDPPPFLGGDETILVVDDERPILETAEDVLTSHGYKVITADQGEAAVDIFSRRRQDIDLVLLDLGMPGMGGRQCLKELLQIDPNIKVLVASGYSAHIRESVMETGAKGAIGKPYRLADLLALIRRVLDGQEG